MHKKISLNSTIRSFTLLLSIAFNTNGQDKFPKNYFINPLDIPITLAGTFGEIRSNHFHTGLDMKTNQQDGLVVHAAADGYVSRINVSGYGYGNALYITHPNGYVTVYGHLS
ncbi:MAG TPA: peptidoglycan DD-metalloendopeptidase family protein, partial [Bacteroidia bacterium]|nr:peptidoglycan DD-metalloendopeptidase family protein [Bacteroidia bacterium]